MSAWRLAKFNLDHRQSFGFIGLPTPANALVIVFLPLALKSDSFPALADFISEPVVLSMISLALSVLLVSNVSLMAMKFKSFVWRENKFKYLFLIVLLASVLLLKFWSAPFLLLIYITLSRFEKNEYPST
jgi:CDP-diacylglycerol--serine O-phosphatidyltransferase